MHKTIHRRSNAPTTNGVFVRNRIILLAKRYLVDLRSTNTHSSKSADIHITNFPITTPNPISNEQDTSAPPVLTQLGNPTQRYGRSSAPRFPQPKPTHYSLSSPIYTRVIK